MSEAAEFERKMIAIYQRAQSEVGYNATRYLQMLDEHGAEETAHLLLASSQVSDGYTALWERGRLDLTVEALVLEKDWGLFSHEELKIAKKRLGQYGYFESWRAPEGNDAE